MIGQLSRCALRGLPAASAALALAILAASDALAVDGTWTNPGGGSWAVGGNWSGGAVAGGVGATADFSALNLAANATLTLDGARTIGNLVFGDATTPDHGWILDTGSGGPLTLQTTTGTPRISVVNQTTTINAGLAGTRGFIKDGSGTLLLSGALSYSGPTVVNAGTLRLPADVQSEVYQAYQTTNLNGNQAYTGSLGYSFQINPGRKIVVTQLGFYDDQRNGDGLLSSHVVKITDAVNGSTLYVSGTIPAGAATTKSAGYRFATLTAPVVLGEGTYRIWGDSYGEGNYNSGGAGPAGLTADGGGALSFVGTSYYGAAAGGTFPGVGDGGPAYRYGAASFSFSNYALGALPLSTTVYLGINATLDINGGKQTIAALADKDQFNAAGEQVLLGSGTLAVGDGTSNTTFSGSISGIGGTIVKTGASTLVLAGNNSYTGGTTVSGGTLKLDSPSALGPATNSLAVNSGTLDLNGNSIEVSQLSGAGGTIADTSGTGATILTVNQSADTAFSGMLTNAANGSLGFVKSGNGTLRLSGANSHNGPMTVNAGTLELDGPNAAPGALGRSTGLTINSGATVKVTSLNGAESAGTVPITVNTDALLTTADGIASHIGPLTLAGGTLASGSPPLYGNWWLDGDVTITKPSTISAQSLVLSKSGGVTLDVPHMTADVDLTIAGSILNGNGVNPLIKAGDGILALSGVNTYRGGTSINVGTVRVGADANLGTGSVTLSGGTLQITAPGFSSAKTVNLLAANGTIQIDGAGSSAAFSGPVSGPGGLNKTGEGELLLGGVMSYAGATVINSGKLRLGTGSNTHQAYQIALQNTFGNQGGDFTLGYDFTVNQTVRVTQLGFYNSGFNALANAHDVKITDATDGTILYASATVPAGMAGAPSEGYRFADLNEGEYVELAPGTYRVWGLNYNAPDINWNTFGGTQSAGLTDGGTEGEITFASGGHWGIVPGFPTSPLDHDGVIQPYGAASFLFYNPLSTPSIAQLPAGTAVVIGPHSTLDMTIGNQTIGSLADKEPGNTTSAVLLGANRLTVGDSTSTTFSGVISGNGGSLLKQGSGTLTLAGANTYTGGTTIDRGLLRFAAGALPGTGIVVINGGGALEAVGPFATATAWLAGGRIEITSAGTLALAADEGPISLGSYASLFIGASADVNYTGTIKPSAAEYRLGGGGGNLALATPNALTGDRSLLIGGGGGGAVALNAANDFTGGTAIDSSTLRLGHAAALGPAPNTLTVNGGVLELNGFNLEVTQLSGAGGTITDTSTAAGTTTLTVNQSTDTVFSGVLTNGADRSVGLVKKGTGALRLTAVNGYTGPTTVNEGTLELNGPNAPVSALGQSSALIVNDTGTVRVVSDNGGGNAGGNIPVTINSGGRMTTADGVASHIGPVDLAGGQLASGMPAPYGSWYFDGDVTLSKPSTLSATAMVLYKAGGVAFDVPAGSELGISGNFVDGGGASNALIKTGDGTLSLSGISSHSGGTAFRGGKLVVAEDANLGTGGLTFSGGTLQITAPATFSSLKTVNLGTGDGIIHVESAAATADLTGPVNGSGGLKKTGEGALALSGSLTYAGATVINGGILKVVPATDTTHQAYQITDNTISNQIYAGSLGYAFQVNPGKQIVVKELGFYDGGLDGLASSHTVTITDSATGATVYASAVLPAGTESTLEAGYRFVPLASPVALPAGTYLVWGDNYGVDGDFNAGFAAGMSAGPTDLGATGELTLIGSSYYGLSPSVFPTIADGGPAYRYGAVSLKFDAPTGFLPRSTAVLIGPGSTLDASAANQVDGAPVNQTIGSLADQDPLHTTGEQVLIGANTLTVGDLTNTTFSGAISGDGGALVKQGVGRLTLKGANTYPGGTTVIEGTLEIGSATSLPAGRSLTIGSGGTVVLSSGLSVAAAAGAAAASPVPEPGTVMLLLTGAAWAAGAWVRRRRTAR